MPGILALVVAENRAPALVLVDFDDTLVDSAPRFQNARRELFRVLAAIGFAEADIYRIHHDEIDPALRKRYGFGPRRLEHSFRATYEALCAGNGHSVEPRIVEHVQALGRAVAGTPPPLAGALVALARLATVVPTAIYTQAGDPQYQLDCIRDCGILDTIPLERVRVVEQKTTAEFRRVLAEFGIEDASTAWMIGNSMRSDINPALEAGANAIHVEVVDPWEYDHAEPYSERFHRVASFAEAADLLLNQEISCR